MTAPLPAVQPSDEPGGEQARRAAALDDSFTRFLQEHYSPILKFLHWQCFDSYLAEDALHEALIEAMGKWATVSTYQKPRYWVQKVAWHKLQNLDRQQKWKDHVPLENAPADLAEPTGPFEAAAVLRYALSQLPYRQRAVLTLMVGGETDERIAEQLSLALTTVRTYKSEVRKRFRELFQEDGEVA
jgi:RNA polymerase sigma factor (sigma-70 family)